MEAFRMTAMAFGNVIAQAVYVAARLGIADLLEAGPKSVDELARASGAHAPSLGRLLRALASFDVFVAEETTGRYALNPLGATLLSARPGSVRDAVLMAGDALFNRPCGEMTQSIVTGQPAFERVFGARFFDYLARHPEAAAVFDTGMAMFSEMENTPIAAAYDFSAFARVIDVGGGRGGFLAAILRAHPDVRGALYDLPHVVKEATVLDSPDLRGRTSRLGGDFLQSVPALFDAYVLKRVLHDWDDDTCVAILRRCREGLPAAGRVLAIDAVVRPGNEPDPSKVSDLLMMILCPGRERTEAEFAAVYAAAGLRLTRVVPTPTPLSIVEGAPA